MHRMKIISKKNNSFCVCDINVFTFCYLVLYSSGLIAMRINSHPGSKRHHNSFYFTHFDSRNFSTYTYTHEKSSTRLHWNSLYLRFVSGNDQVLQNINLHWTPAYNLLFFILSTKKFFFLFSFYFMYSIALCISMLHSMGSFSAPKKFVFSSLAFTFNEHTYIYIYFYLLVQPVMAECCSFWFRVNNFL